MIFFQEIIYANRRSNSNLPGIIRQRSENIRAMALVRILLLCFMLFTVAPVQAQTEPDPRAGDAFDFMNVLAKKGCMI